MKAEEARLNVKDYILKNEEKRIAAIEKRIKSGMYDSIFHQIKQDSLAGRTYTRTLINEPHKAIHFAGDFEYLGYRIVRVDVRNGFNTEIRWGQK